jgi:hypothetical protein
MLISSPSCGESITGKQVAMLDVFGYNPIDSKWIRGVWIGRFTRLFEIWSGTGGSDPLTPSYKSINSSI